MVLEIVFFVLVAIALIVVAIVLAIRAEKKRKEAFAKTAAALGLTYLPEGSQDIVQRFSAMEAMNQGDKRRTRNLIAGSYRGIDSRIFEFIYVTYTHDSKGHRQSHTHYVSVGLALLNANWPKLTIVPENIGHKIFDALGGDDIDFESDEFSRKFWVKSSDRKFAYDVLHARAMEHLLTAPWKKWEFQGACVCVWHDERRLKPEEVPRILDSLVQFVDLLPSFRRPPDLPAHLRMPPVSPVVT